MSAPLLTVQDCFRELIGITGNCQSVDSITGINANDIDIDSDFINQIITREYSGVKDFHEKKLAFAVKEVVSKIKVYLSQNFRVNTLLDDVRLGIHRENLIMVAGDGTLKGINIDLNPCNSYLDLFVSEIALQLDVTQNVDVLVYDLLQDKLLDTITIDCHANEISRAYPRKTYKSEKQKLNLLFAYDSTGISSNTTNLIKNCRSGCGNKKSYINNPYEIVKGVTVDPAAQKVKSSLTTLTETGGMSIVHSLACNHESWLCSYANIIAPAVLYKYGENVMDFAMNVSPNDRINTTLNINTDALARRVEIYSAKFREEMKFTLENIKTPSDRECFSCRDGVRMIDMAM